MGQTEVVTLPGLDTYSSEQLATARASSSAFARYERLITEPTIPSLHARRHRAWMECVLATYFQTSDTETVCAYWSAVADQLLCETWSACGLDECEALLVALGKQGADELNLSSDIDMIVVADLRQALTIEKGLRRFQQALQAQSEWGFCYRLDFDLRPGGKMGPLMTSPSQFQDYYWSQGETWERLALVRLRPITGSPTLRAQIEDLARHFSFRKFLDFTLLDDLKALRSQVHQKGFERRENELHLKLEVGGIRDIELFVHSLLVLNGGKLPELRTRSTGKALKLLAAKGLLTPSEADFLLESYWVFRHNENLVQSVADRQTHVLSTPAPPVPTLNSRADLQTRMQRVDKIVSALLGQVNLHQQRLPATEADQRQWLAALGFKNFEETWDHLIKATALSHKNDRDERARQEFLFTFVVQLAKHEGLDRDLGLNILLDFVRATRGKATFFSMLLHSPRLIEDLARLFCLSPYLGSILAARPELLDHFILQVDEAWSDDVQNLLQQMSERKLLTEIWAANQFLSDGDLPALFERISSTADQISLQLLKQLKSEFPQSQIEIVALGKWGGRELGLRSDLDFVFITPHTPHQDDFKVARRFISRLTDPLKSGNLYDVDLRLRPSGQSGPLLVAKDRLLEYWTTAAQPWERQAYLRARPLDTNTRLPVEELVQKHLTSADLEELKRIREKLLKPEDGDSLDLKYIPGGLIDIEFAVQTALLNSRLAPAGASTLTMIDQLAANQALWGSAGPKLKALYLELRRFEQMFNLASPHKVSRVTKDHPTISKAASLMGLSNERAWTRLSEAAAEARQILNTLDPTGLKI
ncbi:MAG: glutamine-synthetase adenylyltransferase [Bdellovibrionales bacterium]|nr:glutamine-synthetase adenylyltransferase [Bdellovibrionales bacterium]